MKFNIEKATQVLLRGGGSEFMQDSGTLKFSSRLTDLMFEVNSREAEPRAATKT